MSNVDIDLEDLEMTLDDLTAIDEAIEAKRVEPTFEMEVEYANPKNLRPNPWNPNNVDPVNMEKLRTSVKRDGIKRPIVVRQLDNGDYQIIGGQHRTEVAIELGMPQVPIINRGQISDSEAKKETLLDNFRYGRDNIDRFAELLSDPDMGDALSLIETMPIDEEELAEYFSHLTSTNLNEEVEALLKDDDGSDGDDGDDDPVALGVGAPVRTHQIIRFRVSVEDQAKLAELVKRTKIDHGYVASDDLTNDGDALIHLLRSMFV